MRFRAPTAALAVAGMFAGILATPAPLGAQRPFAAVYDTLRFVQLSGTVTRVEWVNPVAAVYLDVRDATGTVANWAIEIGNPLELERGGWSARDLRAGDRVAVFALLARDARRQAVAWTLELDGLRRLFGPPTAATTPGPAPTAASSPAPRWPDGQVRLGPPPGEIGYWGPASAAGLVERSSTPIPMDQDGLLTDLGFIDLVAPFRPWSRALYEHRQRTYLADDPLARCIPPGGPRQFQRPNGFQFVEQRELGRILVLLGGGNRNWRVIYTDGRPSGHPDEVVLAYYGTSVGQWEGDTLVVDSVGYNESFWFTNGGLPHTEALHLVERFTRTSLETLEYEVTVDDPRAYTRSWTSGWAVRWVPGAEIQESFCEEGSEATFRR
jgi:hypothetical protein